MLDSQDFYSSMHRAIENVKETHRAAADFVLTELQLGLEFADRSINYANEGKNAASQRNLCAAKSAYKAIKKFIPHAKFMPSQRLKVKKSLARLTSIVNRHPSGKGSAS